MRYRTNAVTTTSHIKTNLEVISSHTSYFVTDSSWRSHYNLLIPRPVLLILLIEGWRSVNVMDYIDINAFQ